MELISGPIKGATKVCIYGPEGIGKSTLASQFPKPLFIDTEGSTRQLNVTRTPAPTSWQMLIQQVEYVRDNPNVCKTLIIDTADWAERLCIDAILAKHKMDGLESFGYGKGYVYLSEEFGRLLNLLSDVIEVGIHVVLTAHAIARKFEQPGEAGSYDRWELKLQRRTAPLVKEWADMVLFANYKTIVVNVDGQGTEKGRNIGQGGKRVMYTTHSPVWDAKNRHGLPDELDLDYAAIAHIFADTAQATEPSTAPTPEPAPELVTTDAEPAKVTPTINEPTNELLQAGVPQALVDLMTPNGVTLHEIQEVVADRGYFPQDTPFANYPKDFVDGVLIAAWPQVLAAIEKNREAVPF